MLRCYSCIRCVVPVSDTPGSPSVLPPACHDHATTHVTNFIVHVHNAAHSFSVLFEQALYQYYNTINPHLCSFDQAGRIVINVLLRIDVHGLIPAFVGFGGALVGFGGALDGFGGALVGFGGALVGFGGALVAAGARNSVDFGVCVYFLKNIYTVCRSTMEKRPQPLAQTAVACTVQLSEGCAQHA